MAANKVIRVGPAFISNSVANILNCNVTSLAGPVGVTLSQPYIILRRIRIVNKSNAAVTFTLYIGATGASASGTEVLGGTKSIAAYDAFDWVGLLRLDATDFLTGIASAASALIFEGEGEIGIS